MLSQQSAGKSEQTLTKKQKQILEFVKNSKGVTATVLAKNLKWNRISVFFILKKLHGIGLLQKRQVGKYMLYEYSPKKQ